MGLVSPEIWHTVEQLVWPADWTAHFGRVAPLIIEIGFGNGLFLLELARSRPEANVLGVEISIPALRSAGRKVARAGLTNVRLLQAEAEAALLALCRPESVDGVIINFPDPWPKKGQHHRRLIDDAFLRLLATRLRPGAHLDIATDHEAYAVHIEACLLRSSHFSPRTAAPYVLSDPDRTQTKYERVALEEGRAPRYFLWRRKEQPAEEAFPIPEEFAMPHVVLRGPIDWDEIGRRFQPHEVESGPARIRYIEMYRSLSDGKLLVETYVNEAPIVQRLALELRPRAGGEVVVSLAEVGFPRPTRGVHHAVHHLVQWLAEAFPPLVAVQSTLQVNDADDR